MNPAEALESAVLVHQYPQLTEKAVVDLVNGMEVVNDHLRCRSVAKPAFAQIWHVLTGQEARQQYLIDVNLSAAVGAVTSWLQDLQALQAESDLALAVVASKLAETRAMLSEATTDLERVLTAALAEFDTRLDDLTHRMNELESRMGAEAQLEGLLQQWDSRGRHATPPVFKAFVLIDELWWGAFGRYCRMARDQQAVADLIQRSAHKVASLIARDMKIGTRDLAATETWLVPLGGLPEQESLILAFLAEPRTDRPVPLFAAFGQAAGSEPVPDPHLPYALSASGMTIRLFHESNRITRGLAHGL